MTLSASSPPRHYTPLTIVLHWISLGLVAVLWLHPRLQPGLQGRALAVHVVLGCLLGGLLTVRIAGRVAGLLRRHALRSDLPAEVMHLTLYGLLLATIALGGASLWAPGASLFGWLTIPAFAPNNRAVWRALAGLHGLAADLVVVLTGVHVTAALAHHYLWRDGLLYRMLPASRRRRGHARTDFPPLT